MRVPEAISQPETQPEKQRRSISFTKNPNHPHSFGDFAHGTTPADNQVNLLPPPLLQERGDLASTLETRRYRTPRETRRSPTQTNNRRRSTTCAFPSSTSTTSTSSQPKGMTTIAYSLLLQTTMEAPATWTLVLFQQAIDRQDRTTD